MENVKHREKQSNVFEKLFSSIMSGQYAQGERIPNELELAEQYGVSRPTVAKALGILEKKGLVYRKSGVGTFVRKPEIVAQQKLGLLMPRLAISPMKYDHFVTLGSMIISEISRRANLDNHVLLLNDLPHGAEDQVAMQSQQICQQLIDLQVKGVFFTPFEFSAKNNPINARIAERLRSAGIAVTLIDRDVFTNGKRSNFDIVGVDNYQGAFDITEHLIGLGCKKVDFVTSDVEVSSITKRKQGYRGALEKHGIPFTPENVHRLSFLPFVGEHADIEKGAVSQFLKNMKADALVCVNDRLASIILDHASKTGIKIPDQIKIVGFDDEPFGAYLTVPLTTVKQPAQAIGAEAMRVLISRSQEPDMPPREIMLKAEIVIRQSCGSAWLS